MNILIESCREKSKLTLRIKRMRKIRVLFFRYQIYNKSKPKNIPIKIFKSVALFQIVTRCIEVIPLILVPNCLADWNKNILKFFLIQEKVCFCECNNLEYVKY